MPKKLTILEKADRLVDGARRKDYGHPAEDYARVAQIWSAILGFDVTPEQAALCMIGIKLSRECNSHKEDNLIDIAGYAKVVDLIHNDS